jgi:hypothetical protein
VPKHRTHGIDSSARPKGPPVGTTQRASGRLNFCPIGTLLRAAGPIGQIVRYLTGHIVCYRHYVTFTLTAQLL